MPRGSAIVIALRLYQRPGCHLCEEMKRVVARVAEATRIPIAVEEIDISTDAALEERYGLEIPVLEMDGKKIAKYRVDQQALARILASSPRPARSTSP